MPLVVLYVEHVGETHRKGLCEELAGHAHLVGDEAGRLVVAHDQPPQVLPHRHRQHHRRRRAHVLHVLEVAVVRLPQRRPAEVDGPRVQARPRLAHDVRRHHPAVDDDADVVEHELVPRSLGHVGGGVVEAQEGLGDDLRVLALRHHLAVHVLVELVDHDPVVERRLEHLLDDELAHGLDLVDMVQPVDGHPHALVRGEGVLGGVQLLHVHHKPPLRPVQDEVDRPPDIVVGQPRHAQRDGVGEGEVAHGEGRLDALLLDEEREQARAEDVVVRPPEELLRVGAQRDDAQPVALVDEEEDAVRHDLPRAVEQPRVRLQLRLCRHGFKLRDAPSAQGGCGR
mmetsp:Transcript_4351/g.9665  ORF Transcript_4351/g.9665 Transcript_4351/m.9665 type:complete len:340 (-) Transcript_4351:369-1388(-)